MLGTVSSRITSIATKANVDQAVKMGTDKIITVSNENARQIMENNNVNARLLFDKFQELRQDVQDEFHRLGESFSGLVTQTVTGNETIVEELNYFRHLDELQRKAGRLDIDALRNSITNMSSEVEHLHYHQS